MGVEVTNSGTYAVESEGGFSAESERLIVRDNLGFAGIITNSAGARWPDDSEVRGEGFGSIVVEFEEFTSAAEFINVGAPYVQRGDINGFVHGLEEDEYHVVFGPGVTVVTDDYDDWSFGFALMEFNGTEEEPIVFGIGNCDPWLPPYSCPFGTSVITMSGGGDHIFSNVEFRGLERLTIKVNGSVHMENLTVTGDTHDRGLDLSGSGELTENSSGIEVQGTGAERLLISGCSILASLPADTSVSGVTEIGCSTFSGELHDLGGRYHFDHDLNVEEGGSLTIHPGVVAWFDSFERLYVPETSSLTIAGSAEAPVTLRAANTSQEWTGIAFDSPNVSIDYAVIEYARGVGAIYANAPFTLTNSIIRRSENWAISKLASDTTDYAISNTFEFNTDGDITTH